MLFNQLSISVCVPWKRKNNHDIESGFKTDGGVVTGWSGGEQYDLPNFYKEVN